MPTVATESDNAMPADHDQSRPAERPDCETLYVFELSDEDIQAILGADIQGEGAAFELRS
jgi:hypothetical protein